MRFRIWLTPFFESACIGRKKISEADSHNLLKESACIGRILKPDVICGFSKRELFGAHQIDQCRNALSVDVFERRALQILLKDSVQVSLGYPQVCGDLGNARLLSFGLTDVAERSF